jgi:hypothetical protein
MLYAILSILVDMLCQFWQALLLATSGRWMVTPAYCYIHS